MTDGTRPSGDGEIFPIPDIITGIPLFCRKQCRALFGAIPENGGNRDESTTTELPATNKQTQKHHSKDRTTANRMTVLLSSITKWEPRYDHGNYISGIGSSPVVLRDPAMV